MKSKTIIITVLAVLTCVLLYRVYKAGESIVLEQDIDRIGQRRQGDGKFGSGQQRLFASATWWSVCKNRQNRRGRVSCRMRSCGAVGCK